MNWKFPVLGIAGTVGLSAIGIAFAASALELGASSTDDQHASSSQDSTSLDSHDLECPRGYYVANVEAVETTWGLYPSIAQVTLTCRNIDDRTDTERVSWPDDRLYIEGASWFDADYVRDQGCAAEGGFMTGLRIDSDRYIKDLQVRCGEKVISTRGGTRSVKIDNHGYSGDWLFDRTESDDDTASLVCDNGDRVMTGVRLRYKEDADEIALTRVQLICATVRVK
ncbi:MAG: hypothetical protein IT302_03170 [Dehalococcoidia bacterium]|nr:hypothetical protein [Dehalococcoidia bacterium]